MPSYIAVFEKIPLPALIVLSATSVILGDLFAKSWSVNHRTAFLAGAIVCYLLSGVFYVPTLLKEGLVVTSLAWSVLSIVGFLFIGLVLFKETLSAVQIAGVLFGITALVLLSF